MRQRPAPFGGRLGPSRVLQVQGLQVKRKQSKIAPSQVNEGVAVSVSSDSWKWDVWWLTCSTEKFYLFVLPIRAPAARWHRLTTHAGPPAARSMPAETMGRTATRTWRRGKAPVASSEPSRLGTRRATSNADFWRAEQGGRYFVYRAPARSPRSRPHGLVGGFVAIAASFSTISSGVLLRTNDLGCARRRAAPSTSACLAVSRLVVIADDGRGARACIKAV
jgi:hypothetical protein